MATISGRLERGDCGDADVEIVCLARLGSFGCLVTWTVV